MVHGMKQSLKCCKFTIYMKKITGEPLVLVHLVHIKEVFNDSLYIPVLQMRHSDERKMPTNGE